MWGPDAKVGVVAAAAAADYSRNRSRNRNRAGLVGKMEGKSGMKDELVLPERNGRVGGRPLVYGRVQGTLSESRWRYRPASMCVSKCKCTQPAITLHSCHSTNARAPRNP